MAERCRAGKEEARPRRLAEEEEARIEEARRDEWRREDEVAAERCRTDIRDEENRIEAVRRTLALIDEQKQQELARQAMQQGVQQQPLLHSRAIAYMTMMPQENVQHEPEQPEMEAEEAEEAEETEEARRTVVLTNNDALATHSSPNWFGPGLASAQSQSRFHMVPTWFKLCPGSRMVPTWFPIGSCLAHTHDFHLAHTSAVGITWEPGSQVGTWCGPPGG